MRNNRTEEAIGSEMKILQVRGFASREGTVSHFLHRSLEKGRGGVKVKWGYVRGGEGWGRERRGRAGGGGE